VAAKSDVGVVDGSLSHPERRALRLAAQGRSDQEIAERVFLGSHTVRSHLAAAFAKLAAGPRTVR
jgi:DNA-binding CsgD family transcriptional regulator